MNQSESVSAIPNPKRWWVLAVISCALFMILLDTTIVNIAVPHIMTAFNVSLSAIEWSINVYVLVFAVLLLTLGKLGDLFGRKLLFMIGLAVFTVASLACSIAPTFTVLLLGRGIQAVGSAAMMPATLSILNFEFGKTGRGLALGIWGAVSGAANALGPVVGGLLVDNLSWHYIFLINIPIGIIAFIAAIFIVRESRDTNTNRHIDVPGILTISASLFCLTFALVQGQGYGWTSPVILGLFAAFAVLLAAFIFIELKQKNPLAQLRLFRNKTFAAGNIIGMLIMFGFLGVIFLLVLFMQVILGFSAIKAGLTIMPLPLSLLFVAPFAGKLTDKIGGRWILFAGTFLMALGIFLMSNLSATTQWMDLMLPFIVTGVGMGMVMAPVTTVVMASTPVEESGMGAGILSTMRQIGSVMGISVLGAILQSQLSNNINTALARLTEIPAFVRDQIAHGLAAGNMGMGASAVPSSVPAAMRDQLMLLFKEQFALSLDNTMKIGIVAILIATIASLMVSSHIRGARKPLPVEVRAEDEKLADGS
jgi:EmrB/QacA subfamily drug resistance transporter